MTLDIRGSLKNTALSKNRFIIFDELFTNAVDSFLIRKHHEPTIGGLRVTFTIELFATDLEGEELDLSISCKDNGFGMGDEQTKAFLTKDTSYKDDLSISGVGHCKGAGRIQYFHHFSKLSLNSIFRTGDKLFHRSLSFEDCQKEINDDQFSLSEVQEKEVGTTIELSNLKHAVRERIFLGTNLSELFTSKNLKQHVMVSFMHRLVGLKSQLGDFEVSFKTIQGEQDDTETLHAKDLPKVTTNREVQIYEHDPATGIQLQSYQTLKISHYKLNSENYDLPNNVIALCAKSSPVKFITSRYLRPKAVENNPVGGFYHVLLIEGETLDNNVNEQRDDFDIPQDFKNGDLFIQTRISFNDIYDAIGEVINELVALPSWKREEIVQGIADRFGVSEAMLIETGTKVRFGDTPSTVVSRVFSKYQEQAIRETSEIFDMKEEISNSEPDTEAFRQKVNELAWKYTASLKSIDMANLSQLIVRRAAIVEILALACSKQLAVQDVKTGERRKDESLIHSIFFPMQTDSNNVSDHDIWLLNEEYLYYEYIASDISLSKIRWDGTDQLFDADIDDEFAKLLKKNSDDNALKRPDIALFSKEGSAIIVEFKAPGVSMDDHVGDLMEYAQLLAAKSQGRLKKFYGYLIGDTVNQHRIRGYTRFPSDRGYFGTDPIIEHSTGMLLGELYSEILYYDDIVDRANKRLEVYKQRLKVDLS